MGMSSAMQEPWKTLSTITNILVTTSAACINAGCNLELGNTAYQSISSAVKAQLLTEEKVRYTFWNVTFETANDVVILI